MDERLRMVREMIAEQRGCKITQQAWADELGISKANIESYEQGRRNPSESFVRLICQRYGVSIEWLKTGAGEMFGPLSREQEIAKITAQMFQADESDFRYQLQKLISEMNQDEIDLLKKIAEKLARN